MSDSTKDLKEDIDEARESVRGTLSELSERLSPKRAASDVTEWIQEEMGPMMRTVGSALRKHSLPAAAAGAGIAWLVVALLRDDEPKQPQLEQPDPEWSPDALGATRTGGVPMTQRPRVTRDDMSARPAVAGASPQGSKRLINASAAVRASADDLHRSLAQINAQVEADETGTWAAIKHKASAAFDAAQAHIAAGTEKAKGYLSSAYQSSAESVSEAYDYVGDKTRQAGRAVSKSYDNSPLLYGLIGIAAGTALAMMLPPTRREDQLMGPSRDSLIEAAEARLRALRRQAEDATIEGLDSAAHTLRDASASLVAQIQRAQASAEKSVAEGADAVEDVLAEKLGTAGEQSRSI